MLVNSFENNGKNITKNIVKLNLKQNNNLYYIIIWSTFVQRKYNIIINIIIKYNYKYNFMVSLPDKTENSL